jgi:hypothetical protein
MRRLLIGVLVTWFVVTWSGKKVAGPFDDFAKCQRAAKAMAADDLNISKNCLAK